MGGNRHNLRLKEPNITSSSNNVRKHTVVGVLPGGGGIQDAVLPQDPFATAFLELSP